jgi:hypothetical protein
MKKCVSGRVLLAGITFLLATGVAWSENTTISGSKTTTAKNLATKSKTAKPATPKPKIVFDYFMLLPQDFFEFPKSHLKSYLYDDSGEAIMVDEKNDYLHMWGDAAQASIYMALFRYKGRVLVGVYSDGEGGGILNLMRYENGKWRDVTKSMLPVPYNDNYQYIIPRYGTTIKVTTGKSEGNWQEYGRGKKVYGLVWTQGKFKVRRS